MKSFHAWQRVLLAFTMLMALFGLVLALGSGSALFAPLHRHVDGVFWPDASMPAPAARFRHWGYGVLGSTIAGFGVVASFVVAVPFRRREVWAWWAVLLAILVWYVPDTALSAYHGVFVNVAFNTVVLAAIVVPTLATRKFFFGRPAVGS